MTDWHELVERDHELQNPTSADKVRLAGEYLRLGPEDRVLDVACGKGGPAVILAERFGCRIHGIELREAFAAAARERIEQAGLAQLVDVETADASAALLEPHAWDAALCLGAAFVWGHIGDAAAALVPAVRPGGGLAIGEPFWRERGRDEDGFVDLPATVARLEAAGVAITGLVAASEDDWDRYESLHWRAAVEALAAWPDADLEATHRQHVERHIATRRFQLGWAIFVARVPG